MISRTEQAHIQHIETIFDIILKHESVYKRDIQKLSGYSWGTVSTTVNLLVQHNLIREIDPKEVCAGRPPKLYEINPDRFIFIGIDINIESVQIVAIDIKQTILFSESIVIPVFEQHFIVQLIIDVLHKFINIHYPDPRNILGIGISLPFSQDKKRNMFLLPSYIKGWTIDNLKTVLEKEFNILVIISHTSNNLALAELSRREDMSAYSITAFISIDYDIFTSILIRNGSMNNYFTLQSSFGHTYIESNPETCSCGKTGCLQAICSIHGLASAYQRKILNNYYNESYKFDSNMAICKRLYHAASQNNQEASELFLKAGRALGIGIGQMANLLNPDTIILGGSFMQFFDCFRDEVMEQAARCSAPHVTLNIQQSVSDSYGSAIGAALYIIHQKPWKKYFLEL